MIARSFLLLVGMLVFLVHNDEAERIDRREDRRARADDDAGTALADLVPLVMPLAGGKMAVQDGDQRLQLPGTEPGLEAFNRLGRQRNFRHEHNGPLALLERVGDGLEIDFRLAAAGGAVKEKSAG